MLASRTIAAVCAASLLSVVTSGAEVSPARAGAAVPTPVSNPTDVLPFRAVEKTLPNGLKVIAVRTGFPNIESLQIPVNSGSRNEIEVGKTGFAHFFEHMMFRGTRAYPPDRYQGILTRAGAAFSALKYDAEKPAELLAEDKVIGARKLGVQAEDVRITPVEEVFAR